MRLKLLANDVKTARECVDWGDVNGEKVIRFADAKFTQERLQAG
ncbi:MAG: hypothetical protein ETSY2_11550 [Candidatus Entotheonella gemina]|uniref:Uncharacterized protein n=1 Tax=Candidatus Entotheonella gemina TaxID=1429439 RepID=W4MB36_9BACT|nr:MAG: hypothetical protein ETSY2_11550 [Candidatus Entotheonella gemina]